MVSLDSTATNPVKVGLLGAGVMGKQIALVCIANNLDVVIWNRISRPNFSKDLIRLAMIESKRGNFNKETVIQIQENARLSDDLTSLNGCDIIIEAIKEDLEAKLDVLRRVGKIVTESTIVGSTTSSMDITVLGGVLPNPSRFLGMHFFNPPTSIKLVEVVSGKQTAEETVQSVVAFLQSLGRHPIVLPDIHGSLVNRILFPMINEAIWLLSKTVVEAETIDKCMRLGAIQPMGPLELADYIGLDICLSILETLYYQTGEDKYRPSPLLTEHVRNGRLGRKVGRGFYTYGNTERK